MIFMPERREKDILFDTGYRAAIDDMQDNLIRNSRTETIDGRIIFAERPIYDNICEEEVDKVSGWFYERYPDNATGAVPLTAPDIENLEMKVIGNISDE